MTMCGLYLASVWLHVIAVTAWIGGMIFLVAILVPLIRHPKTREHALPLFHAIGIKFRRVGWIALGTLVVTGLVNLSFRGFGIGDLLSGRAFEGEWGETLATKLLLVVLVLGLGVVHDFFIGPMAVRLANDGTAPERGERYRRAASWMGRGTLVLALTIVALATRLVR